MEPLAFKKFSLKARDYTVYFFAGWSSPVARQAHNLKVRGSNPLPATRFLCGFEVSPDLKCDKAEHFRGEWPTRNERSEGRAPNPLPATRFLCGFEAVSYTHLTLPTKRIV